MAISRAVIHHLQVQPGHAAGLPEARPGLERRQGAGPPPRQGRQGREEADEGRARARPAPRSTGSRSSCGPNDRRSLLLVFQAMDAAGKDGTIKHVMSGVNPQGCRVTSFKQPSALGARPRLPVAHQPGPAGARADRHLQPVALRGGARRPGPPGLARAPAAASRPPGAAVLEAALREHQRLRAAPRPQRHDHRQVLPPRLPEEQRRRFLDRLTEPGKEWKFSSADVAERQHWDAYMDAYEKAITATSTPWAPWYVIPADNKDLMRMLVAGVVVHTIRLDEADLPDGQRGAARGQRGGPPAAGGGGLLTDRLGLAARRPPQPPPLPCPR